MAQNTILFSPFYICLNNTEYLLTVHKHYFLAINLCFCASNAYCNVLMCFYLPEEPNLERHKLVRVSSHIKSYRGVLNCQKCHTYMTI